MAPLKFNLFVIKEHRVGRQNKERIKLLMSGLEWSSLFFFPENLNVAWGGAEGRLQIYENKSREQSTFTGNSALLSYHVIDFTMLSSEIWVRNGFIVRCRVMWPRSNQALACSSCWEQNFQVYNKNCHCRLHALKSKLVERVFKLKLTKQKDK